MSWPWIELPLTDSAPQILLTVFSVTSRPPNVPFVNVRVLVNTVVSARRVRRLGSIGSHQNQAKIVTDTRREEFTSAAHSHPDKFPYQRITIGFMRIPRTFEARFVPQPLIRKLFALALVTGVS
jgi:hypothetical protein